MKIKNKYFFNDNKKTPYTAGNKKEIRQRSALPGGRPPSTIDAIELNFCVRYGNRWSLNAVATGFFLGDFG